MCQAVPRLDLFRSFHVSKQNLSVCKEGKNWVNFSAWVPSDLRSPWWPTLFALWVCSVWSRAVRKTLNLKNFGFRTYCIRCHWFPNSRPLSCAVWYLGSVQQDTSLAKPLDLEFGNVLPSTNHLNHPYIVDGCWSNIFVSCGEKNKLCRNFMTEFSLSVVSNVAQQKIVYLGRMKYHKV